MWKGYQQNREDMDIICRVSLWSSEKHLFAWVEPTNFIDLNPNSGHNFWCPFGSELQSGRRRSRTAMCHSGFFRYNICDVSSVPCNRECETKEKQRLDLQWGDQGVWPDPAGVWHVVCVLVCLTTCKSSQQPKDELIGWMDSGAPGRVPQCTLYTFSSHVWGTLITAKVLAQDQAEWNISLSFSFSTASIWRPHSLPADSPLRRCPLLADTLPNHTYPYTDVPLPSALHRTFSAWLGLSSFS